MRLKKRIKRRFEIKVGTLYDFNSVKYIVDDDKLNLILKKNDLYDKDEPSIEVKVLYKREILISNKSLSVENGWECRSEFFLERADITYIWAKAEDEIYRAYKVNSSNIKRWCKYLNQYYKACCKAFSALEEMLAKYDDLYGDKA